MNDISKTDERRLALARIMDMAGDNAALIHAASVYGAAVRAEERERCAMICEQEAANLDGEADRIKVIDPEHSKYCGYLAYHARRYSTQIRQG